DVLLHGNDGLGQTGFFVQGIEREVEDSDTGIAEPVCYLGAQQASVGRDIDPESLLRGVVDDLVHEVGAQQGLSAHQRQDAAAIIVQKVDGTTGHVFGHPLHFVVV